MKAYVDCGIFKGSILRHFLKNPAYGPSYRLYAFECNPSLSHVNYGDNVTTIRKAIWTHDGEVELFVNHKGADMTPTRIEGHSVYKEKRTGRLDKDHPIKVPCIDFSAWLQRTFTPEDYVVVKMNIEGAEYDVLEKCVADGSTALIDELHIQWHFNKISVIGDRHNTLIWALNKLPLKLFNGYGKIRVKR